METVPHGAYPLGRNGTSVRFLEQRPNTGSDKRTSNRRNENRLPWMILRLHPSGYRCSCRLQSNRGWKEPGGHAATASTCDDSKADHPVYLPSSPLSSAQRAWSNICAPRRVQRMCCFFSIRQSTSWSTVDSTPAVDMPWPSRCSLPSRTPIVEGRDEEGARSF